MKEEIKRRLKELGLPEDNYPLCFANGVKCDLSEEDKIAIQSHEKDGNVIIAVTHDTYGGVIMNNYIVVSEYEEDWDYEFRRVNNHVVQAMALVSSELTHGTYDAGTVFLKHKDGAIRRVEDYI